MSRGRGERLAIIHLTAHGLRDISKGPGEQEDEQEDERQRMERGNGITAGFKPSPVLMSHFH